MFGALTGLVLLAVVIVPVAFGTWLQRRSSTAAPGSTAAPSSGGGTPGGGR
jgi:hypothetical protein